jgi:outer membrane receptor for ferrienterochelin and colicin
MRALLVFCIVYQYSKKKFILSICCFFCLFLPLNTWAQRNAATQQDATQRFSISGYISDAESGERLIGANVLNVPGRQGSAANAYGFYSLSIKSDSVQLRYSFVGYESKKVGFLLSKDTVLHIQLKVANRLQEVVVNADRPIEENTQMSRIEIPVSQIKAMPALLGEVDVLKVLQLLPGVQSGMEGSSGIYVRGGGPDQNLILLDGVPVYNASHLFGFFSVFNADAINRVELIKGGFPARYGGRLSSVIDISMKEGNMKEFRGEGGIGLIASRLTLEGPLKKDVSSFLISGRRTYLGEVASLFLNQEGDQTQYYFYDLNGKLNYKFSDRDRLYLSAYTGDDRYKSLNSQKYSFGAFEDRSRMNWGNITTALRWNHVLNQQLFSNTTLTYSRYRYHFFNSYKTEQNYEEGIKKEYYETHKLSGIQDFALKTDFDYLPNPNHLIRAGAGIIHHTFQTGAATFNHSGQEGEMLLGMDPIYALEHALYVEDDFKISERMKVNAGLHFSGFSVLERYYPSLQPRISGRYMLKEDLSLKASYASMAQFIHLLTNTGIGLPTDLWVPSTDKIKPQQSSQLALGLAKTIRKDYELSLEGYYKKMDNLIEYQEGTSFMGEHHNWEEQVDVGQGWSYGGELFMQKKTGRTTGWFGYTLSWNNRQFEEINFGEIYPFKYDRRHDISLSLVHKFNERTELSGTWVFGTGNAITLPTSTYQSLNYDWEDGPLDHDDYNLNDSSKRNEYRMPAYHRLDIGLSRFKKTNWGERRWVFGIYNAYNRANPFYMAVGINEKNQKNFTMYSLFQIIPSISYNFSF